MAHRVARRVVGRVVGRVIALGIGAASVSGCYEYRPIEVGELRPAMTVRIELTAVAVDRLRNSANGERRLLEGFSVSGAVERVGGDSVIVSVATGRASDPALKGTNFRQPISLASREVQRSELRTLDRRKTTWTTVIISTLSLVAAAYAIKRGGDASGSTPVPGGPNELRVPFSLRLP